MPKPMHENVELGRLLRDNAEAGYFEVETHRLLSERFAARGFRVEPFEGMPGFAAFVGPAGGKPGSARRVVMLADMDGLPSGDGGYAHTCGHHLQMTALYATACLLQKRAPQALEQVTFAAVPAEEFVDFQRREPLIREGRVRSLSGKQELLARGFFRGARRVVATHAANLPDENRRGVSSVLTMNGFEVLRLRFSGVSAHAGAQPHKGRNAQNAASLFLHACAFLRESFDEQKHVRIHPILRLRPEQPVNFIPDLAFIETYVRASDTPTIQTVTGQLIAAAEGCSRAIGVTLTPERLRGYAPFRVDPALHESLRQVAAAQGVSFTEEIFSAASTDVGDISQVLPAVIVGLPGTNGRFHSPEFAVLDEEAAYVFPAEILSAFILRLLQQA
jgi:amidohydrolase